jgi:hypothetical protein
MSVEAQKIYLSNNQAEVLVRSEREVFTGGSRFGGKSLLGRIWLAEPKYIKHPQYSSLIIRRNSNDLNEWIEKAKIQYKGIAEVSGNPAKIHWPGGGVSHTGHLKDLNAVEKYLGQEHHKILIEELPLIKSELDYIKLLGSCRSTIDALPAQCMSNGNPGGPGHKWVKDRFVKPARNKPFFDSKSQSWRIFIPLGYQDNPGALKDPQYIGYLQSLPPKLRAAWLDGDWDVLTGSFFNEFTDNLEHIKEKPFAIPPHKCNLYGGMDYGDGNGVNSGATSFGLWHIDERGYPHRLFTYYKRGLYADAYAREIVSAIQSFTLTGGVMPKMVFADPSIFAIKNKENGETFSIAKIFQSYGLNVVPANNDRVNGWRVCRDCHSLDIEGRAKSYYFEGYNDEYEDYMPLAEHKESNPNDIEKGGEDHICDEVRYGLVGMRSVNSQLYKLPQVNNVNTAQTRIAIEDFEEMMAGSPTGGY